MARVTDEFVAHLLDLMQVLGPVEARRMFGGYGIFLDGLMFALVDSQDLYFKVDDRTRVDYDAQGLEPFRYFRAGKPCALNYYQAPESVIEEQPQMRLWGNQAYEVAIRAAAAKRRSRAD
ncbi:transcriptional regulator [Motiliproteus coralliicola]|uniref:Transcriptional regulator n=1 Tax=Motiliproteus coralliicola TaxID=2283196 RepID=A0A369WRB1_9GAMM|nr:TfoX/Sxy family protein [Motiliproteus coralliicola]RDE23086.1 transcriptional regulator [Motiliproteus coralliicola]